MNQKTTQRFPELVFVGIDGILVRFGSELTEQTNQAALAFHRHINANHHVGVLESAPSLTAVFLRLDIEGAMAATLQWIEQEVAAQDWFAVQSNSGRHWTIPCCFDGPQLGDAAALARVSEQKAVAEITASTMRVLTLGFAPGQPYLGSLEPHWNIPRMDGIAPNVPAQALVVAVRQLIIFNNTAPTGWRHIGQTAFRCFDKDHPEPFALQAGDVVRFEQAGRADIDALLDAPFGGARMEVLS
jgi:KipI family sensor histidine kinase inhibitor